MVPFIQTFKEGSADKGLGQKLMAEADGILGWAIRGCLEWQSRGLKAPPAVKVATDEYQEESDPLAGFLADRCVVANGAVAGASALYREYRMWADEQGLRRGETLSSTRFGCRMGERFHKRHSDKGNLYEGVGLKAEGFEPVLKGSQSNGGTNRNSPPTQSTLAKEIEKPSDPSDPSGDDGRRLYALSLCREMASPTDVRIDEHRSIKDVEMFLAKASDEDVTKLILALEARAQA
jgi:phage/plasmid-associated DNA primase